MADKNSTETGREKAEQKLDNDSLCSLAGITAGRGLAVC